MQIPSRRSTRLFSCGLLGLALAGCGGPAPVPSRAGDPPPAQSAAKADRPVDFAHDVVPILQKRCVKCHAGTQRKGGFSINSRQSLVTGGDGGAGIVPGKSADSQLVERVTSDDPAFRMPPEGELLTAAQVDALRRWIDAGAAWEDGFAFGKFSRQAPLAPRRPPFPNGPGVAALANPVDRFLLVYFREHNIDMDQPVPDRVFLRRASFDLIGLPPGVNELSAFEAASKAGGRDRAIEQSIDRLLSDDAAYAAHWMTFWNDLLRNAYHGTGFIDGGRKQITGWLYAALSTNMPYDRFVRELVSPDAGSGAEGFTFGIKWRGTVNESQRREIQAAQSVGQVFLGTNLKCASCHDSFVNHWKLTDAYALASVFAEKPLELHRCDQPTGTPASVGFLYPQLGTIDAKGSREERMRELAELIVHPQNGRFSRTIVNRLWARLFGRGLVEPLDNMDAEPWHQDLLDYLASDLADHGYDLKRTLRLLATSRAYRMPGVGPGEGADSAGEFVFRGPLVKRLSAEQFVDTVYALTNTWPEPDPAFMKLDGRAQGGQLGAIAQALDRGDREVPRSEREPLSRSRWIWSLAGAEKAAPPETIFFRHVWQLDQKPARAIATFTADNSFELFINGQSVAKSDNWGAPVVVDVTTALIAGTNVIGLKATNGGDSPNPAGAIGEIVALDANGKPVNTLSTDEAWRVIGNAPADWLGRDFDDAGWSKAAALGRSDIAPWEISKRLREGAAVVQATAQLPSGFRIRAAVMPLDSLQAALGRPIREQVVSSRDSAPTMLQALELTNGPQLGQYVQRGASYWRRMDLPAGALIDRIYETALTRPPTPEERAVAAELLGSPATIEGLEDLLWSICMYPEFQLVP